MDLEKSITGQRETKDEWKRVYICERKWNRMTELVGGARTSKLIVRVRSLSSFCTKFYSLVASLPVLSFIPRRFSFLAPSFSLFFSIYLRLSLSPSRPHLCAMVSFEWALCLSRFDPFEHHTWRENARTRIEDVCLSLSSTKSGIV